MTHDADWPDPHATSFLVVALGASARRAAVSWTAQARAHGPVDLVEADDLDAARTSLDEALRRCRTGVRILIAGSQYDVQQAGAAARAAGACTAELTQVVTATDDAAVYCVHCRAPQRVHPIDGLATCPGCARTLEVYDNQSAHAGAFLAATAGARTPARA